MIRWDGGHLYSTQHTFSSFLEWTWKIKKKNFFFSHPLVPSFHFPSCCLYARTEEVVHIRFFHSPFISTLLHCHWRRWCSRKKFLTKKQFLRWPSHSQIALTLHFFASSVFKLNFHNERIMDNSISSHSVIPFSFLLFS